MFSGCESRALPLDGADTGFESSAAGVESGKIRSEPGAGAGFEDVSAGAGDAEGSVTGFADSVASESLVRFEFFRFPRYCPNCKRCHAVYPATANSTTITNVLTIVFVLPESWVYEKFGAGTAAASNVSRAPESAVIASCEANGAALLSSTIGFSSAGATAA